LFGLGGAGGVRVLHNPVVSPPAAATSAERLRAVGNRIFQKTQTCQRFTWQSFSLWFITDARIWSCTFESWSKFSNLLQQRQDWSL